MAIMMMTTNSKNEYEGAAFVGDVTGDDEWRC